MYLLVYHADLIKCWDNLLKAQLKCHMEEILSVNVIPSYWISYMYCTKGLFVAPCPQYEEYVCLSPSSGKRNGHSRWPTLASVALVVLVKEIQQEYHWIIYYSCQLNTLVSLLFVDQQSISKVTLLTAILILITRRMKGPRKNMCVTQMIHLVTPW